MRAPKVRPNVRWLTILSFLWLFADARLSLAQIDFSSLTSLSEQQVSAEFSRAFFDRRTGEQSYTVTLRNRSGAPIGSRDGLIYLAVEGINPASIPLVNALDLSVQGIPYLTANANALSPGTAVDLTLRFSNPTRGRFTFTARTYIAAAPANNPPIANAGPDVNAVSATLFRLNGSASYDPDADLITYAWSTQSIPSGSVAALAQTDQYNPSFTPDQPGNYIFQLITNDGLQNSSPDYVTVLVTTPTAPPSANAGPDREARVSVPISLDGKASSDPQGSTLAYHWTFAQKPPGSVLGDGAISNSAGAVATFTPDVAGTFLLLLTVNNGVSNGTDTTQVVVVPSNAKPIADAGADQATRVNVAITLDGSRSSDPDTPTGALVYQWALVSRPTASNLTTANITSASAAVAGLAPDALGRYVLRLTVGDGSHTDSDNTVIHVENTPPQVTITKPINGGSVNTARPEIGVVFSDNESGIDTSSFRATINGVDRTTAFAIDDTGALSQPTFDLPAGNNRVFASVKDRAGNQGEHQSSFTVGFLRAIASATPAVGTAPLTVRFTTAGDDPVGTIQWYRWDFDGNGTYDSNDTVANDYSRTYTAPGVYNAKLHVDSSTGNSAETIVPITVRNNPPTASADVTPSNGPVPLIVTLRGSGSDTDGSIVKYEWDFEGDGTYDYASTTTGNTNHEYASVATYTAVFRVTDNSGNTATAVATTTTVRTGPPGSPTAVATVSPASGNSPLTVTLTGAATDPNNDIALYEWDFENDGVFDFSSSNGGNTSHVYSQGGTHIATLRVTDATGLTGIDQVLVRVNLTAGLAVSPNTIGFFGGVTAAANASSVYSAGYPATLLFDGNTGGTPWYTAANQTAASWFEVIYSGPRIVTAVTVFWNSYYYMQSATIELFDQDGLRLYQQNATFTGGASRVPLPNVENVYRLRVTSITANSASYVSAFEVVTESIPFGPPVPRGANILTTLSAGAAVTLTIKDAADQVVRTLVANQYRAGGSYADYWNAADDRGVPVPDGSYFAILEYLEDGQRKVIDYTDSTGGTRYSVPTGTACDQRETVRSSFSPYADDLLPMVFRSCKASEWTVFIGPLNAGGSEGRTRTIVNRKVFPAGTNTVYWDGLDDQGNLAHPPAGDALITGFWRYDLPTNAMVMTGSAPTLTGVTATPNYFNPLSKVCRPSELSVDVTYTVNEDVAAVELRVIDLKTKETIHIVRTTNVVAGANVIRWRGTNSVGDKGARDG
jgi:PKD repeat protein/flagellar hook assembly protein FlgD